jgi:hypothetical protein
MKQKLKIKSFEIGNLVSCGVTKDKFKELHPFTILYAQQDDEWLENSLGDKDEEKILDFQEMRDFFKWRTGIIVDGPRPKKLETHYHTYYKILIDKKLYWVNLLCLFQSIPRSD